MATHSTDFFMFNGDFRAGKPPDPAGEPSQQPLRKPTFKEKVLGFRMEETKEVKDLLKEGAMQLEFVEGNETISKALPFSTGQPSSSKGSGSVVVVTSSTTDGSLEKMNAVSSQATGDVTGADKQGEDHGMHVASLTAHEEWLNVEKKKKKSQIMKPLNEEKNKGGKKGNRFSILQNPSKSVKAHTIEEIQFSAGLTGDKSTRVPLNAKKRLRNDEGKWGPQLNLLADDRAKQTQPLSYSSITVKGKGKNAPVTGRTIQASSSNVTDNSIIHSEGGGFQADMNLISKDSGSRIIWSDSMSHGSKGGFNELMEEPPDPGVSSFWRNLDYELIAESKAVGHSGGIWVLTQRGREFDIQLVEVYDQAVS
ncbi:hypothetical protein Droror1_Dr00022410, partial [Drosera rotundifolia]